MHLLAKIQVVLTALVAIVFVVGMRTADWLHSMAYDDPVRREWQPRLDAIEAVIWFGTLGVWFLFSIFHVMVVLTRRADEAQRES